MALFTRAAKLDPRRTARGAQGSKAVHHALAARETVVIHLAG